MTRTYALQRLLQHGAMSRTELAQVTGWAEKTLDRTLTWLTDAGRVERATATGVRRYVYRLPADHFLPVLV
jgi:predicted transcriptional regulator